MIALDCVGSFKPKKHSFWAKIIGRVVLESVNCSQIAELIYRCVDVSSAEPLVVCEKEGTVFKFNAEWRQHVFKILTDERCGELLWAASLMHKQRMKNRNSNHPLIDRVVVDNMDSLVSCTYLLDAVLLLCDWHYQLTVNKNLFPIKFDGFLDLKLPDNGQGLPSLEHDFVEAFWRFLGESGLFLAPAGLCLQEMKQLISRLDMLVLDPVVKDRLLQCMDALKLQFEEEGKGSSSHAHIIDYRRHCWDLVRSGFSKRLEYLETEVAEMQGKVIDQFTTVRNDLRQSRVTIPTDPKCLEGVPEFFKALRDRVNKLTPKVEKLTSGKRICARLQHEVRTALNFGDPKQQPIDGLIWYLTTINHSAYLMIPVLQAIMKQGPGTGARGEDILKKYTKYNSDAFRQRWVKTCLSIEKCRSEVHNVQAAEDLQVQLLYPSIVFETIHRRVLPHFAKSIQEGLSNQPWGRKLQMRELLKYAKDYVRFLRNELSGFYYSGLKGVVEIAKAALFKVFHPLTNPKLDPGRARWALTMIEIMSHCVPEHRKFRAIVHACVEEHVSAVDGSSVLDKLDELADSDALLLSLLNKMTKKLDSFRFMGILSVFTKKRDQGWRSTVEPSSSSDDSCDDTCYIQLI